MNNKLFNIVLEIIFKTLPLLGGVGGGLRFLVAVVVGLCLLASCARMGNPDGGWYDEEPPYVLATSPRENAVNFDGKRIYLLFNEYIKMDNAQEKVVVSPPQLEQPEIKVMGDRIRVELKDSLKAGQTYTIDFSDAISDNNEGNPLGNYTFTFSTSDHIDTMEVAGTLIDAESLEPIKGLLVGLYEYSDSTENERPVLNDTPAPQRPVLGENATPQRSVLGDSVAEFSPWLSDTLFRKQPMIRISRSDATGHFTIKGVAKDKRYRIFALEDNDGNYMFSQKSERLAFTDYIAQPGSFLDTRQDTIWQDALHIKDIALTPYTHFTPDDIVLRVFQEKQTDRHLLKTERKEPEQLSLYFTYGHDSLPVFTPLTFEARPDIEYLVEHSANKDTITYWLSDSLLINNDSLVVELRFMDTDSLGVLQEKTDTVEFFPKFSFERRQKLKEEEYKKWQKEQEKLKKKNKPYETEMPRPTLPVKWEVPSILAPDQSLSISVAAPLAFLDTTKIHIQEKVDTLWEDRPYVLEKDTTVNRLYHLFAQWKTKGEYRLQVDSFAMRDIYDRLSIQQTSAFKIGDEENYGTLEVTLNDIEGKQFILQLLFGNEKVAKQIITDKKKVKFRYLKGGDYYLKLIVDEDEDGKFTTGIYDEHRQPEEVFFYHEKIEIKEKWDKEVAWSPKHLPLNKQKPAALVKQKAEKKKTTRVGRNLQRARDLGYKFLPDGTPVQ